MMGRLFKENGLSIALLVLFAITLIGQFLTGFAEYNEDLKTHNKPQITHPQYLTSGHFLEAVFENMESEFLQMAVYVVFTVFLFQKGSSESKTPGTVHRVDLILKDNPDKENTPWAIKKGGIYLLIYQNSLSLAFVLLFLISFFLHAYGGAKDYNQNQLEHNLPTVSLPEFMTTSRFWFESLQNWQSEFFSIAMMVLLSIFLRQKGSPESKPVDAPHSQTGE
jgi:hypothetical protein